MGDSSLQRVGECWELSCQWRETEQVFILIDDFITMITSWALLDRDVDVTVDDRCEDANMYYMEWWLATRLIFI